jgi:uncharacterized protein (TIGR02246 family)
MERNRVAAIVVLVTLLVSSCSRSHNKGDEQAVMDAQRRWEKALQEFDLDSLQSLLAEDYSQTDLRGKVQDRASWFEYFKAYVAAVHAGDAHFELSFEDVKMRVYGESAVVTGGAAVKGQKGGVLVNNVIRFTNVWVRRQGTWHLVSYQATPVERR